MKILIVNLHKSVSQTIHLKSVRLKSYGRDERNFYRAIQ